MDPKNNHNNDKNPGQPQKPKGTPWGTLLITVALVLLVSMIFNGVKKNQYTQTTFSDFMTAFESGQLAEVELHSDRVIYLTKEEAAKDPSQQRACYTGLPSGNILELAYELVNDGVKVTKVITEDNSMIMMILSYAVMIGGMYLLMTMVTRRMGGDGMMELTVAQGASIFAASLPIGLVGIFSGYAQGKAAASGIMLIGKKPSEMAKGMLFAAMVETYAVLALPISFLMLNSIQL